MAHSWPWGSQIAVKKMLEKGSFFGYKLIYDSWFDIKTQKDLLNGPFQEISLNFTSSIKQI